MSCVNAPNNTHPLGKNPKAMLMSPYLILSPLIRGRITRGEAEQEGVRILIFIIFMHI